MDKLKAQQMICLSSYTGCALAQLKAGAPRASTWPRACECVVGFKLANNFPERQFYFSNIVSKRIFKCLVVEIFAS